MLKRMELYVDAALMSIPVSVLLLGLAMVVPIRGLTKGPGGGGSSFLGMLPLMALVAGVAAIWLARVVHRKTTAQVLEHQDETRGFWAAITALAVAALLWIQNSTTGSEWRFVWMSVAVALLGVSAWLIYDSIRDISKARTHKVMDAIRLMVLAPLGVSLVAGLVSPASPGTDQDIGMYVVGITAYMLLVAVGAFLYDWFAGWRSRSRVAHGGPAQIA
jgi:hypothetical protein